MKSLATLVVLLHLTGCHLTGVVETPRPRLNGNRAVQVPGNPGFYYSPFAIGAVWIDATGLPSGSLIKCPVTGKTIILP